MDLVQDDYLRKIHRDALRVLEEVGVKCASPEVRRIFEETGLAAYDETTGHIHVLSPLVEQALNMEDRNQALLVARGFLQQGEKTSRYF